MALSDICRSSAFRRFAALRKRALHRRTGGPRVQPVMGGG
jgi:hypothetical protein